ncbi:unnamed protein product [Vitrella brassicaformis CCMP3155]|uniref:Uncharacterized protein n=4 Tax=Vitrella brassicaformis TaxID=1169539 RepID=A0A0G4GSF0_VITBC|nr:unnamed protein product [Vitrella brassicaformis CCMP3155]|eukprot:CEM33386.1 unnamed protein product [Vitrella brassicaformis CCMP3155]
MAEAVAAGGRLSFGLQTEVTFSKHKSVIQHFKQLREGIFLSADETTARVWDNEGEQRRITFPQQRRNIISAVDSVAVFRVIVTADVDLAWRLYSESLELLETFTAPEKVSCIGHFIRSPRAQTAGRGGAPSGPERKEAVVLAGTPHGLHSFILRPSAEDKRAENSVKDPETARKHPFRYEMIPVWDGLLELTKKHAILGIRVSLAHRRIAVWTEESTVWILDFGLRLRAEGHRLHREPITSVDLQVVSKLETILLTGSLDNRVNYWLSYLNLSDRLSPADIGVQPGPAGDETGGDILTGDAVVNNIIAANRQRSSRINIWKYTEDGAAGEQLSSGKKSPVPGDRSSSSGSSSAAKDKVQQPEGERSEAASWFEAETGEVSPRAGYERMETQVIEADRAMSPASRRHTGQHRTLAGFAGEEEEEVHLTFALRLEHTFIGHQRGVHYVCFFDPPSRHRSQKWALSIGMDAAALSSQTAMEIRRIDAIGRHFFALTTGSHQAGGPGKGKGSAAAAGKKDVQEITVVRLTARLARPVAYTNQSCIVSVYPDLTTLLSSARYTLKPLSRVKHFWGFRTSPSVLALGLDQGNITLAARLRGDGGVVEAAVDYASSADEKEGWESHEQGHDDDQPMALVTKDSEKGNSCLSILTRDSAVRVLHVPSKVFTVALSPPTSVQVLKVCLLSSLRMIILLLSSFEVAVFFTPPFAPPRPDSPHDSASRPSSPASHQTHVRQKKSDKSTTTSRFRRRKKKRRSVAKTQRRMTRSKSSRQLLRREPARAHGANGDELGVTPILLRRFSSIEVRSSESDSDFVSFCVDRFESMTTSFCDAPEMDELLGGTGFLPATRILHTRPGTLQPSTEGESAHRATPAHRDWVVLLGTEAGRLLAVRLRDILHTSPAWADVKRVYAGHLEPEIMSWIHRSAPKQSVAPMPAVEDGISSLFTPTRPRASAPKLHKALFGGDRSHSSSSRASLTSNKPGSRRITLEDVAKVLPPEGYRMGGADVMINPIRRTVVKADRRASMHLIWYQNIKMQKVLENRPAAQRPYPSAAAAPPIQLHGRYRALTTKIAGMEVILSPLEAKVILTDVTLNFTIWDVEKARIVERLALKGGSVYGLPVSFAPFLERHVERPSRKTTQLAETPYKRRSTTLKRRSIGFKEPDGESGSSSSASSSADSGNERWMDVQRDEIALQFGGIAVGTTTGHVVSIEKTGSRRRRHRWTEVVGEIHATEVMQIDYSINLNVFASISVAHEVRIWNRSLTILKQIAFPSPLTYISFKQTNESPGDLLIGFDSHLSVIPQTSWLKGFLPTSIGWTQPVEGRWIETPEEELSESPTAMMPGMAFPSRSLSLTQGGREGSSASSSIRSRGSRLSKTRPSSATQLQLPRMQREDSDDQLLAALADGVLPGMPLPYLSFSAPASRAVSPERARRQPSGEEEVVQPITKRSTELGTSMRRLCLRRRVEDSSLVEPLSPEKAALMDILIHTCKAAPPTRRKRRRRTERTTLPSTEPTTARTQTDLPLDTSRIAKASAMVSYRSSYQPCLLEKREEFVEVMGQDISQMGPVAFLLLNKSTNLWTPRVHVEDHGTTVRPSYRRPPPRPPPRPKRQPGDARIDTGMRPKSRTQDDDYEVSLASLRTPREPLPRAMPVDTSTITLSTELPPRTRCEITEAALIQRANEPTPLPPSLKPTILSPRSQRAQEDRPTTKPKYAVPKVFVPIRSTRTMRRAVLRAPPSSPWWTSLPLRVKSMHSSAASDVPSARPPSGQADPLMQTDTTSWPSELPAVADPFPSLRSPPSRKLPPSRESGPGDNSETRELRTAPAESSLLSVAVPLVVQDEDKSEGGITASATATAGVRFKAAADGREEARTGGLGKHRRLIMTSGGKRRR